MVGGGINQWLDMDIEECITWFESSGKLCK
jgi:hypothetical protein